MVQISSKKSPYSSFEPLSNSFIFRGKSANAFKSATKREEICTIIDPEALHENEGLFCF